MHKFLCTLLLLLLLSGFFYQPASAEDTPPPTMVGLPGTHQDELGCPGDWTPACEQTLLRYDPEDDLWQAEFLIQPGNDDDKRGPRYKVALNGAWDENYGKNAARGGGDIPLVVNAPTLVKFYYDHKTHWVADNFNTPILIATGDFQQALGCAANNDPTCLRAWLQDPDGDGLFTFATRALKAGTYSLALAQGEDAAKTLATPASFTVKKDGDEIYFGYDTVKNEFTLSTAGAPRGNLAKQKAHWVRRDLILWNTVGSPKYSYSLFYSPAATLALTAEGVSGGEEIPLEYLKAGADAEIKAKFPHLAAFTAFRVPAQSREKLTEILQSQIALIVRDENGKVVDVTGAQIPGVLDDLFACDAALGLTFSGETPSLSLWAPTAKTVSLLLFDSPADSAPAASLPMQREPGCGVWSLRGEPAWSGKFYLYQVEVYVPSTGKIEKNLVTDPYSLALSVNSQKSQIANLADPALQPSGWESTPIPPLAAPEDIVVYELHIRDFSASDASVPENLRGTYLAFTAQNSNGMKRLRALAAAGLTHIHLLPAFDIASVNEDKSTWQRVDENALAALPPDSEAQAQAVSAISGTDAFNWGYDPYHYSTPEGSYALNPQGAARTLEFRQMVQALHQNGLRVVMDVVYNHTNASGQEEKSVLDKVVPGYYHRLNEEGQVETSTCCSNTASEHAMMRKLMVDSVLTWARAYKVDGFRFDLMGHHMLADMQAVRAALDALTLEKDGVDGKSIYIYGEGWNFGEVANNARGVNATQQNIGGSGIGVFNDRLRDAARGGNPFSDPREQGFATGLFFQPNSTENRSPEQQKAKLLDYSDWIRIGLAGNLAEYPLTRANGDTVPARLVLYNGSAVAYTRDPQENIVYVSAHDNETLWDAIQLKAPESASLQERVRRNNLALSLVAFSQGVPFFHAGDDLLRSKSLDRNSYNSGDWFNRLDWTMESNNWGVGLPGEGRDKWDLFRPLLANPALKAGKAEISFSAAVFEEWLKIRKSSPLFRLQNAEEVQQALHFLNTGPEQIPGLIVMRLDNSSGRDPRYQKILVFFNANPQTVTFKAPELSGQKWELHPIQAASMDETVKHADFDSGAGTFSLPGLTTAVFVLPQTPPLNPAWTALALLAGLLAFAWSLKPQA